MTGKHIREESLRKVAVYLVLLSRLLFYHRDKTETSINKLLAD
jgi:hypothetical protein